MLRSMLRYMLRSMLHPMLRSMLRSMLRFRSYNKAFLGFKKGGYNRVKKVESSFLEQKQIIFMDPLGVCSASSLQGINLQT